VVPGGGGKLELKDGALVAARDERALARGAIRLFGRPRRLVAIGATALLAGIPAAGNAGSLRAAHGGSTSNVYLLNVSTGSQRLLTHNREGDEDALAYSPMLSPDGRRLAFAETRCHYCSSVIRVSAVGASNWLGRAVAPGFKPAWTPDGRRLVFVRPDGAIAVTTQNLAKPRALVHGGLANDTPSWDPQGKRLVFSRQLTASNWQIFTVRSDGSELHAVTRGTRSALDPAWSPDGRRLAFARQEPGGRWQICVGDLSGDPVRCLGSHSSDTQPAWSPDGRWIAFVRQGSFWSSLWIVRPDGSRAHRIAPPRAVALSALQPRWAGSPDKLVFVGRA
jgi:Tol biopolymer transport system component